MKSNLIMMNGYTFKGATVIFATFSIWVGGRAREIVGFAGSGPIFETEDRFISRQEAKKSVHKTVFLKIL